jgi:hypothetical protein
MQLDKWYFDCQTPEQFAYYYVSHLHLGSLGLVASEVHHDRRQGSFRLGKAQHASWRVLQGAGARVQAYRDRVDLRIAGRRGTLQGSWCSRIVPLPRPRRPLYRDENGWCDWKVWTPHAQVTLTLPGDDGPRLQGTGYVDLVRVALPFWRIPFRSLCWGRLFAGERWMVLFRMQGVGGVLAWGHAGNGWRGQIEGQLVRNAQGAACAFEWCIDGRQLHAEIVRILAQGPILSRARVGRWAPMKLLERLGSCGWEEKYWVEGIFDGATYAGPMEEVRWHAS